MENFQENVELRNHQYQESKNMDSTNDEEEDEGDEYDEPDPHATTRGVIIQLLLYFDRV